ncbi:hypothetical protein ACQP2X_34915 [Actinoplanes sp. CA-131856]
MIEGNMLAAFASSPAPAPAPTRSPLTLRAEDNDPALTSGPRVEQPDDPALPAGELAPEYADLAEMIAADNPETTSGDQGGAVNSCRAAHCGGFL